MITIINYTLLAAVPWSGLPYLTYCHLRWFLKVRCTPLQKMMPDCFAFMYSAFHANRCQRWPAIKSILFRLLRVQKEIMLQFSKKAATFGIVIISRFIKHCDFFYFFSLVKLCTRLFVSLTICWFCRSCSPYLCLYRSRFLLFSEYAKYHHANWVFLVF